MTSRITLLEILDSLEIIDMEVVKAKRILEKLALEMRGEVEKEPRLSRKPTLLDPIRMWWKQWKR